MADEEKKARGFTVEAARVEDIDAIVALERATEFAPRWGREIYAEIVQSGERDAPAEGLQRCLVAAESEDGRVIGFAVGSVHPALPDSAVLESVAVTPAARRAGVGRALCEAVVAWCRDQGAAEVGLEVRRQSTGAIALYRSLGFAEVGMRPGYYSDPADDAVGMRKDLGSS